MKELTIEEMKKIELPILTSVHNFCVQNNLRYSLAGGTMIGAVRHKGFIPWDDDIDIMMPRPDYDKLISLYNNSQNRYRLISCDTDRDYFQPYAKVVDPTTTLNEHYDKKMKNLAVYIDIFPIDGLPDDNNEREKYWKKVFKKRNILSCTYQKSLQSEKGIKKLLRKIIFYTSCILPANFAAKRLNNYTRNKYSFDNSKYVAALVFGYGKKEEVPHSLYEKIGDFKFEDCVFKATEQFDLYLKNLYGDYMQLPPESERKTRHHAEAYYL